MVPPLGTPEISCNSGHGQSASILEEMKTVVASVVLAAIVLMAASCTERTPESLSPAPATAPVASAATPVAIGKPAPDFTVTGLDGKEVKLSSLRGKPVYLDFWATWCPPCRASLPHTQKLATNHGSEITVLAISDEEQPVIEKFRKDNSYNYPTYRDIDDSAARLYSVESIPTFVTIDKDGIVVDYQSGYGGDEPLDAALAKVGIKA